MIAHKRTFKLSRRKNSWRRLFSTVALASLAPAVVAVGAVAEITPDELSEGRGAKTIALVIDLRSHNEYANGHIPGAINIPHFAVGEKSVPPVGPVIAYGDGLGRFDEAAAVAQLNRKPGVDARLLSGGLSAWESAGFPTTHRKGLTDAHVPVITYQQLQRVEANQVVLADLRTRRSQRTTAGADAASSTLSDLQSAFPGARVIEPGPARAAQSSDSDMTAESGKASVMRQLAGVKARDELIVLIDDGDGSAEQVLRELRASGNKRVVLLAGGEAIIERDGRPGLERLGYGFNKASETPQDTENQSTEESTR